VRPQTCDDGNVSFDDDVMPLSASLDLVIRSLRGPDRRQVGGLFGRWDEVVGPHIAGHVRPLRLDNGVLVVEVDDPAWATQIKLLSSDLRTRLAEMVDVCVDDIEIRVARTATARTATADTAVASTAAGGAARRSR
jgi:hypothetical protein